MEDEREFVSATEVMRHLDNLVTHYESWAKSKHEHASSFASKARACREALARLEATFGRGS